ncbi:MAG: hypothetical protein JKX80_01830 [Candidatus Pacebacteria bacterium]|nr:hypothetical protein [Candidatus Paceibacterota bacterium]
MKKIAQKKYIFAGGIALSVLVLLFGILSQAGFVFSGPYLVRGGELVIENARPNSVVFVENSRVGVIDDAGDATFTGIKPGSRSLIISHEDAWPWIFEFESTSGESTIIQPLQVNIETDGAVLANPEDPLRKRAETELDAYKEPSRTQPLSRNQITVWIEGSTIFAREGEEVRTILASKNPIRNILWYGERSDVIIVTTLNNVFALDIRKNQVQNFHPIYTGAAPEAVPDSTLSEKIFVRDVQQYFYISI